MFFSRRQHLDCHGHQRQNVRTAVQLLSRSVANSFALAGHEDKAYAVEVFNSWFDTMDSARRFHYNRNKSGLGMNWESQEESLKKMLDLTQSMVVGKTKTMKGPRKEMVTFQKGIICSIQSVLALWGELKEEGFQWLLTRRLNQDCIENLFSVVRSLGGTDTNPNPVQFCTRIRILKMKTNFDEMKVLLKDTNVSVELSNDDEDVLEEMEISNSPPLSDDEAIRFIAGRISKKV